MAAELKPVEQAQRAAEQVGAGQPGVAAHRVLGPLTIGLLVLFVIDSIWVWTHPIGQLDVSIERAVQSVNWGPYARLMDLTNWLAGWKQVVLGAVAIVLLLIWERRAGYLMALGMVSSLLDNVIKLEFARHRPAADLVHILTPANGFSYPSGHAVFFTWLAFMVAFAVSPHVGARWRPLIWGAAVLVVITACLGRVYAGDHWPSDVVGGFLLGLGWSAFVLWVPERFLPSPSRKWLALLRRRRPAPG